MTAKGTYSSPLDKASNRCIKRCLDIIIAALWTVLLFSWVYVIVAIVTKVVMPGPVLFRQKRTGKDGEPFWIYKFRTMRLNDEADTTPAVANDPRCPKWGMFLRKMSIDELPQVLNVLKGDMSMVGPRPHMIADTEYYSKVIPEYNERLKVKQGLTGWAQANGYRDGTPELWMMQKRVEYDLWYIQNWTPWLDVKIVAMELTLFVKKVFHKAKNNIWV